VLGKVGGKGMANMDAKLKVLSGSFSGQTIQVPHGKLLIGREPDCDLRLESEFVSGYHCVLLLDDYTVRVRDLGSTNGTFMNGRRIGTSEMILLQDDMISIDKLTFQIDLTEATTGMQLATPGAPLAVPPVAFRGTGSYDGAMAIQTPAPATCAWERSGRLTRTWSTSTMPEGRVTESCGSRAEWR
jgi:predicted component of type VI protein secretion system